MTRQSTISTFNDLAKEASEAETRLAAAAQLRSEFDSIKREVSEWTETAEDKRDTFVIQQALRKSTSETAAGCEEIKVGGV